MAVEGPILTAAEARKENQAAHERIDERLRRLELAVLALGLMAIGSGAGSIVAKVVGA